MTASTRPRARPGRSGRAAPAAIAAWASSLLLAGCWGSGPAKVTGLRGLGATEHNWRALHGDASSDGRAYGPTVDTGAGSVQRYTATRISDGRVAGWVMAFPSGTTVADAEHQLARDLPPDTQQTASSRQTRASGAGACEVVAYQSAKLAERRSGQASSGGGRFVVSFFEVQPDRTVSTSYAKVNRAVVDTPASTPDPTCPS